MLTKIPMPSGLSILLAASHRWEDVNIATRDGCAALVYVSEHRLQFPILRRLTLMFDKVLDLPDDIVLPSLPSLQHIDFDMGNQQLLQLPGLKDILPWTKLSSVSLARAHLSDVLHLLPLLPTGATLTLTHSQHTPRQVQASIAINSNIASLSLRDCRSEFVYRLLDALTAPKLRTLSVLCTRWVVHYVPHISWLLQRSKVVFESFSLDAHIRQAVLQTYPNAQTQLFALLASPAVATAQLRDLHLDLHNRPLQEDILEQLRLDARFPSLRTLSFGQWTHLQPDALRTICSRDWDRQQRMAIEFMAGSYVEETAAFGSHPPSADLLRAVAELRAEGWKISLPPADACGWMREEDGRWLY
ncbi:hypothetical protein MKEN_00556000 [Mycena kentingensis (nom. inval.)]|nr:hypothetical protein MKEN_00556000 [Mycena kentingensis (nom. inval.)]